MGSFTHTMHAVTTAPYCLCMHTLIHNHVRTSPYRFIVHENHRRLHNYLYEQGHQWSRYVCVIIVQLSLSHFTNDSMSYTCPLTVRIDYRHEYRDWYSNTVGTSQHIKELELSRTHTVRTLHGILRCAIAIANVICDLTTLTYIVY